MRSRVLHYRVSASRNGRRHLNSATTADGDLRLTRRRSIGAGRAAAKNQVELPATNGEMNSERTPAGSGRAGDHVDLELVVDLRPLLRRAADELRRANHQLVVDDDDVATLPRTTSIST